MLSRKDELWKLVEKMKNKRISAVDQWIRKDKNIQDEDSEVCWQFLPTTFVLPGDWERLEIFSTVITMHLPPLPDQLIFSLPILHCNLNKHKSI